jgi:hypothetical protein
MKSVYRKKNNLLAILVFVFSTPTLWAQVVLEWTKPTALNANLPPSIQVYQTTSPMAGAPLKAYYMIADLADGDIELKAVSGNGASKTLPQFVQDETETVFAIINGGFFSGNQNLSLVSYGGVVSAPNAKTVTRTFNGAATTYYPTRGAFGILNTNQPDVAWVYNVGAANTTYFYPAPSANSGNGTTGNAAPEPQPSDVFPAGAAVWNVSAAIGGSPVLVANGVKQITASEELIDVNNGNKEPRTAVGYTATGKVIFLVVEGRNAEVSNGATLNELADIMLSLGCQEALNLDGGGSSAMQILGQNTIRPGDAGVLRAVPSAFMLRRKPRVYDTENTTVYSEVGTFSNSANTGFFGTSQSRQIVAGTGSSKAGYRFTDLPPAQYKVEAWWVASSNRATNTPFTIHRQGNFPQTTIRLNQTTNSARFNLLGTFNLAAGDSIVISNDAAPPGSFINVDAIRLTKVSEPALTISFTNGDANEHVKGTDITFGVALRSPVNGVFVKKLKTFQQRGTDLEAQVGSDILLNNTLSDNYNFVYSTVNDNFGDIKFRFESEDSFGQKVSRVYTATITPLTQVVFDPAAASGKHENDKNINLLLQLDTRRSEVKLTELNVFKSVNGGAETKLGNTIGLTQSTQTIPYSYLVTERPADNVKLRFEVKSDNGETGQRTYTARIVPKRGDYRIAVVSDLNSEFGAVTYEYQVDSIMKRIPRLFNPNMVVCGGDMVAGQSASLTSTQLDNMWAAFDTKVATPFRNANIPFAFTLGNHDASDGSAFALERQRTRHYWRTPGKYPGMHPIDTTNYPFYFSYMDKADGDIFYVTWDANSSIISSAELEWTKQQFASEAAKKAKFRFLVGHMPLYGIAQERDSPGNVLPKPDDLRQWMEELDVHTYISGHQHAYYPAKRGKLELLNSGAAGSGPRRWLSIDKAPVNTITLMDVFYEQDTIVYTTYDIKNVDAEAMALFNEKELPEIINGFQGFVVRRDVKLKNSATGTLSALHLVKSRKQVANGQATVTIVADTARITGTFANLEGVLLRERMAVSLYRGLHAEDGKVITDLKVISTNGKSGSFSGVVIVDKDFRELLSTGSFYVLFKTDLFPDGEMRTQLYPEGNQPPSAAIITSQNATEVYAVRNIPGLFTVGWGAVKDPETNPVTYTYQLATNLDFTNLLVHEGEGRSTSFSRTQEEMYALLSDAVENQPVSFFHRVIASDGKNIVYGTSQELRLAKSNAPVIGVIEVLPPDYQYNCSAGIDNITLQCSAPFAVGSASNIQGIAVDRFGKVWYGINGGGVWVKNVDGSAYKLTSSNLTYTGTGTAERVTSYTFGGVSYTLGTTGLGTDADGNILIAASTRVVKFDAVTGQPLALFIAPSSTATSFTNPTADTQGRIFVASVTGNNNFIIKQNGTGFDIVANNFALEGRELARASAMSPDGRTIYVPANSGRNIHKYTSIDGINFVREKVIVSPSASGCNSVLSPENNVLYSIVNSSGPEGAKLAVWDDNTNTFWSRELKEIPVNFSTHTTVNMRGLAMTANKDSVYIANNAFGAVYRYIIPQNGEDDESTVTNIPTYQIRQIRKANSLGIADSLGVYCRLIGVVNSQNFRPDGLDIAINDEGYGIQVYRNSGTANYTPTTGDRIAAIGYLRQVNGLLRIETDSIRLVSSNQPLSSAREVNLLSDSVEYFPVRLKRVKLKNQAQWTPNQGYLGFEAEATDGTSASHVFVNSITDAFGVEAPLGEFEISGLGSQFKINSPFTSGYQIMPRNNAEVVFTNIKKLAKDSLVINTVERIPVKAVGSFRSGNTFILQLSDPTGSFIDNTTLIPVTVENDAIQVQLPVMNTGKGYKIRVLSSDPALHSNEYSIAISCAKPPKPTISQASNADFTAATLTSSAAPASGTYQWFNNGTAIAGATAQSYTTSEVGSYTVSISVSDCQTVSDPFVIVITANESSALNEFILYPNPVKDWFTLSLSKWKGKKNVVIYQSSGKVITTQETNGEQLAINATDYPPGVYFIKVTTAHAAGVLKFIKQ